MPCGPLQTMQVYALGTGSFFAGALSMLVFSVGTVPLLLGFGVISSFLSAKLNRRMLKASGVLVMALGLVMFARGLNLFGVGMPSLPARAATSSIAVAKVSGGVQEVRITIGANEYRPFVVQAGIPVKWTISVKASDLNGCNGTVTIPRYGIRKVLVPGDNLVEFTPAQSGTIPYTCWMGMISSTIRVVPDLAKLGAVDAATSGPAYAATGGQPGQGGGSCCGVTPGRFAGGRIPVDTIQVARVQDGAQVAEITVDDQGYTPAVIVMKRGMKGRIRFTPARLSACNDIVSFPDYRGSLDLGKGELETPLLDITGDFSFQCGMGMLHGYVKVVDDTTKVDLEAVRKSVAAFRITAGSSGCCGR
jgi:plastocyanin domain-containing protein